MVLEILKSKPKLKFDVLKEYLLERLDKQGNVIRKNTSQFEQNQSNIKILKKSINELNSQAKHFNPKKCHNCDRDLQLPIIIFMCGHCYHDSCIDSDSGKRFCVKCYPKFKDISVKKEQYDEQAKDPQQFFRELDNNKGRHFHVISKFFGRGLFSDLTNEK